MPVNRRAAALLIVGLALLAWWNAFAGSFQFDDFKVIVDNTAVASLQAWWQSMPGIRPLLKLSYALNRVWAGNAADRGLFGFHAVNLALHIGNALLLYALARRLLAELPGAEPAALLTALLFVLHPVQSEAVTMISGRSMSLMALFYFASLLTYLDGRRAVSLVSFAAALATRETAITLPFALLLIERLRTPALPLSESLARTREHWLLAGMAATALLLLPAFQHLAAVSLATRSLSDNLITQSAALLYLLKQTLWPIALDADPVLPLFAGWNPFWIASVALLATLIGGACVAWRKAGMARWFGFGMFWFWLHLAPTNSLLPRLDLANERHLYLADAGLCLLAAVWLVGRLHARPRLLAGVVIPLLCVLVLATQARNRVYLNEVTFWQDVAAKNPGNGRAFNNLGYALAGAGQTAEALLAYEHALQLQPSDFTARLNRRALCREPATVQLHEYARLCAPSRP
jgi:tetratricopeptide (TPR) repeat protein